MKPFRGFIYPDDLRELCTIYNRLSSQQSISPADEDGKLLGRQLILLYQAGMHRTADLYTVLGRGPDQERS